MTKKPALKAGFFHWLPGRGECTRNDHLFALYMPTQNQDDPKSVNVGLGD